MPKTMYVGADIALKTNVVCFVDDSGRRLCTLKSVPNSPAGFERICDEMMHQADKQSFEAVRIGTEATSVLDIHLLNYFDRNSKQTDLPTQVYRINPRQVKRFKKAYTQSKTDKIDAFFIAEYLRFNQLLAPYQSQREHLPLRRLTRRRAQIIKMITAEKNRLFPNLFLQYPGLVQNPPLSLDTATARALFTEFTPDQFAAIPHDQLTEFLISRSKKNLQQPRKKAKAIKKGIRDSYQIDPELMQANAMVIDSILQTIKALGCQLERIEVAIAEKMRDFPNTLETMPGIGPVYAAGLIAEIGDVNLYKSSDSLAKLAGLVWISNQSGESSSQETPMERSCNTHLRYYMIEAANSLRMHSEYYRSYYTKKYNEANKHEHRRALVLTARKLVRLVYSLLKHGRPYNPNYVPQQPSA